MSRLKEFHELENALKKQMAQLDILKNEDELIAELEFEKKLKTLMARYRKSNDDVMAILNSRQDNSSYPIQDKKSIYNAKRKSSASKTAAKQVSTTLK